MDREKGLDKTQLFYCRLNQAGEKLNRFYSCRARRKARKNQNTGDAEMVKFEICLDVTGKGYEGYFRKAFFAPALPRIDEKVIIHDVLFMVKNLEYDLDDNSVSLYCNCSMEDLRGILERNDTGWKNVSPDIEERREAFKKTFREATGRDFDFEFDE